MIATVAQALEGARALGLERLDAQLIVAWKVQQSRAWLIANDDAPLDPDAAAAILAAFERRASGEPLAYIVGTQEFHGLGLQVDLRVLIPRPDTEVLVDWALEVLNASSQDARVVDLGTGSGAIAIAVKHGCRRAQVYATDLSRDALDVARANALRLGVGVTFVGGSWWEALPDQRFDLVLANPPYIADGDPHLPALCHEPTSALTSGRDGLTALRDIVEGAPAHMTAGARILLEHGYDQAAAVQTLLRDAGFDEVATRRDVGGRPRVTGARR